jgi:hypothetical protein
LLDDYNFTPSPRQGVFYKEVLQRNL